MQKYRGSDIKSFEFSDLQGNHVVTKGDFKPFSFGELTGEALNETKVSDETLREERGFEKNNNFKIDGVVRASRGIAKQEESDLEKAISEEVNRRLEVAYANAYNEGLEKGRAEGQAEAYVHYQEELNQKIDGFMEVINGVQAQNGKLMEQNRHEVYEFIKRFTKWICLKEIDEKLYLEKLLEKLILELNARKNLIIKVGRQNFSQMPEVIAVVESRLGQLQNTRVEIIPEINHPGIILESESGLIDGSIEGVFANIDKIFESVLNHE